MGNKELKYALLAYERKLMELMPEKEFHEFILNVSRECFAITIDDMPDNSFKDFVKDNFGKITE